VLGTWKSEETRGDEVRLPTAALRRTSPDTTPLHSRAEGVWDLLEVLQKLSGARNAGEPERTS